MAIVFDRGVIWLKDAPALTGTPKQIKWADDIRHQMFSAQIARKFDALSRKAYDLGCPEEIEPGAKMFADKLAPIFDQTNAAWWIANRNSDLMLLAKQVAASSRGA